MSEKVTTMVLKVDLGCHRCYNKVQKVLAKFSEIGDQAYDEKANTVTIKVSSSKPEKLRDKIRSKCGKSVVSIDIKEPEKKKVAAEGKKKEAEKPKTEEKEGDPAPAKLAEKEPEKAKAGGPPKEGPSPPKGPQPVLVSGYPSSYAIGAPLPPLYGWGRPVPGQNQEYIGRPIYDSYGGGRGLNYYASPSDYFSEENPSACVVM